MPPFFMVSFALFWTQAACFKSKREKVAVMVVGVHMKYAGTFMKIGKKTQRPNLIQSMTGDEEKQRGGGELQNRSGNIKLAFSGQIRQPDTWATAKLHLLATLKAKYTVDTYVCVDDAGGEEVPSEITEVFAFQASSQFERSRKCVERIKARPSAKYSWYVKVRPDFEYVHSFPDLTTYDPKYVYTRFRSVSGISGLTAHSLSWDYCLSTMGNGGSGIGYINDDMVVAASGDLIDYVFGSTPAAFLPELAIPSDWIRIWMAEGNFTKQMISNRLLTMPLELSGCPWNTGAPHCALFHSCPNASALACTADQHCLSMTEVHEKMRRAETMMEAAESSQSFPSGVH